MESHLVLATTPEDTSAQAGATVVATVFVTGVLGCSSIYPTWALALAWGPGVGQSSALQLGAHAAESPRAEM